MREAFAVDVADSDSTATGSPNVEMTIGRSGGTIIAGGNIEAKALGLYDSDAATSSGAGGAITVNLFYATSSMSPTVKAIVAGGSNIKSTGGTVTLDATAGKAPEPTSDGTFTVHG